MDRERGEILLQNVIYFHPNGDTVEFRLWSGGNVDCGHLSWSGARSKKKPMYQRIAIESLPPIDWTNGNIMPSPHSAQFRAHIDDNTPLRNKYRQGTILETNRKSVVTTAATDLAK